MKRSRYLTKHRERQIPLAALDTSDIRPVNLGMTRKFFLRPAQLTPFPAYSASKNSQRFFVHDMEDAVVRTMRPQTIIPIVPINDAETISELSYYACST